MGGGGYYKIFFTVGPPNWISSYRNLKFFCYNFWVTLFHWNSVTVYLTEQQKITSFIELSEAEINGCGLLLSNLTDISNTSKTEITSTKFLMLFLSELWTNLEEQVGVSPKKHENTTFLCSILFTWIITVESYHCTQKD